MWQKWIIAGCLTGASFFFGCQQSAPAEADTSSETDTTEGDAEPDMYEASELAALMRKMYEDNLALGDSIEAGKIPAEFPEDFYNVHTAEATPGMLHDTAFFHNMARQYLRNMERIKEAETPRQAKIAYNEMVMTCASCHQVYCQGPLPKIRRMKLKVDEADQRPDQG